MITRLENFAAERVKKAMLVCKNCGKEFDENTMWRCECGGVLSLDKMFFMNHFMVDNKRQGLWRYQRALPIDDADAAISLGEMTTPLLCRKWKNFSSKTYFKYDIMPTGSYKDRGVAVMLNRLRELGAESVYEDSSGNAGASIAGYCAAGGIPCEVMVPESTSRGKCVQIEAYGAALLRIPGARDATSRAAEGRSEHGVVYASHNWSPYFAHGVKTWLFEVWEAMSFELPDALVVPVGQGSLVLGAWFALCDLIRGNAGVKIPRIYAVQDELCAPLFKAWKNGSNDVPEIEPPKEKGLAEGIASTRLVRGGELIEAIRSSKGEVLAVGNDAISDSLIEFAHMGIYVEPTSAVVGAALDELLSSGRISPDESVVALLSSSGLKTTPYIADILDNR